LIQLMLRDDKSRIAVTFHAVNHAPMVGDGTRSL